MTGAIVQQWLVAGSTLLAALPIGSSVGFPSVLLQQLKANDSSIQLDWNTASWIGSIHGIAGIPSILVPVFMQWKGRKVAFFLSCLVSIIGWITAFTATTSRSILISESLHGFSSESIVAVGLLSMSEMISPEIRAVALGLYLVMQTLGMALVGIIGSYLHWRTMTLVICAPLVVVALLAACFWPESPSWLAYKGEFEKCTKAFTRLRGSGDVARTELEELVLAQKENLLRNNEESNEQLHTFLWRTLKSKDFYLPAIHILVLHNSIHWTGVLVTIIYSSDIIQTATHTKEAVPFGVMALNIMLFTGSVTSIILMRFFQPKKLLVYTLCGAAVCLLSASAVHCSQTVGLLPRESYACLYILIVYMYFICLSIPLVVTITAELMPVKHRGVGGALYVISVCFYHTSALKVAPYLFKYINLWGTLLVYAVNGIICSFVIYMYIPETKGRTLQQLEDYYTYGNMEKSRTTEQEDLDGLEEGAKLMPDKINI